MSSPEISARSTRPPSESAVSDFPQPDSPTSAVLEPYATVNETSLTGTDIFPSTLKAILSPLTSSSIRRPPQATLSRS